MFLIIKLLKNIKNIFKNVIILNKSVNIYIINK